MSGKQLLKNSKLVKDKLNTLTLRAENKRVTEPAKLSFFLL